jgi:lipid A 3-O-deacylase
VKLAALFVVLWLGAASALGDERGWQPDAVFSQMGAGTATDSWSVGAQWHWRRTWLIRDSLLLRGRWEFAVGRWRADEDDSGDEFWVTQLSAVPSLRLSASASRGWYAEIGSGPSVLMPVFQSRSRSFSTEFNFQSHLAIGHTLGAHGEHDLALRIEHFSNAGIREPNPGMNFVSLRYTYRLGGGGDRVRFAGTNEEAGDFADAAPGS